MKTINEAPPNFSLVATLPSFFRYDFYILSNDGNFAPMGAK